jgi:uncharacterized protein (TIGR02246 family)
LSATRNSEFIDLFSPFRGASYWVNELNSRELFGEDKVMMSEDEKAIRELVRTWMAATKAGNVKTVLSLMAEDVVFMVPGQEPFGKEAFRAASEAMRDVRIDGKSDIREIKVIGDWAYLRNHIDMEMTLPDGKTVRRAGYTLTILNKTADGRWLLVRDANLLAERN